MIYEYTQAIEQNPNFAIAYYRRGNSYAIQGKDDEAIYDYSKAIELDPNFANAYDNRGSAYSVQGKFAEAIYDLTKAIQLNPNIPGTHYDLKTIIKLRKKSEIFGLIKKLPVVKQILLLRQCLDKNTVLGEMFWGHEDVSEYNMKSDTLKEMKDHFSGLVENSFTMYKSPSKILVLPLKAFSVN